MVEFNALPTLELKYMVLEDERANPKIRIYLTLRVDKKF